MIYFSICHKFIQFSINFFKSLHYRFSKFPTCFRPRLGRSSEKRAVFSCLQRSCLEFEKNPSWWNRSLVWIKISWNISEIVFFKAHLKISILRCILRNANSPGKMLVIFVTSISKLIDPARSGLKVSRWCWDGLLVNIFIL